ncbi:hypothetical protein NX059_012200 [Plenodomus lindquistii]|nr:hypothetical protein NX059_012200 [Plenodomus lindquistii]
MTDSASPESPNKRRRSVSPHAEYTRKSSENSTMPARHLLTSYPQGAPHQSAHPSKDSTQQRTLPSLERSDIERRWATEPRELPQNAYQDVQRSDVRPTEPLHNGGSSNPAHSIMNVLSETNYDDEHARELARAGVQVHVKKRKRQFANRTKTGCGTCRKRKKKCDESKPACTSAPMSITLLSFDIIQVTIACGEDSPVKGMRVKSLGQRTVW